jgi:hypothetical protein
VRSRKPSFPPMIVQTQDLPVVPEQDAWKLFVFRKNRESLPTRLLLDDLRSEFRSLARGAGSAIDALVRAGEIETGLADAGSPEAVHMAGVVDQLASAVCGEAALDLSILQSLDHLEAPARLRCSHPEGFSYYGLNPLDFADLARRVQAELRPRVAVVGIRSIGSTLSAVVAATLRASGTIAERITVRPEGEPYRRKTVFNAQQRAWITAKLAESCDFVVVDEGPGFSGSTFLSVAQALETLGVPCSRIVLMGSRSFPARAAGVERSEQWNRFPSYTIAYAAHPPAGAGRSLSDGAWRELFYPAPSHWPTCWIEQERIKHMSADGKTFFKFEGFGRFGRLAREHAGTLAQTGCSPRLLGFDGGYAGYEFMRGRPLTQADLSESLLSRMAGYCAFRTANFPAEGSNLSMLEAMTRNNLGIEFGVNTASFAVEVPLERPVYPDCRMLPHEWLLIEDGRVMKTDAVGHAEGHQLPGPADIAWDLAGTIVEWGLSGTAADFLLKEYSRQSGDAARNRLPQYILLYSVLRMAQCRMASVSMAGRREAKYLRRQYAQYHAKVTLLLEDYCLS